MKAEANELWTGLTWARAAEKKVGVGITQYVSIRNQDSEAHVFAQALSDSGDIANVTNVENYSASVWSLLWKAGLGFNFSPLTVGVTFTTPTVRLFGSGEAAFNYTRVGVDLDNDSIPDNGFETDFQQDLTANYESPWSVGVGAGYQFKRTRIHASAEWFSKVDPYSFLEVEPYVSQTTGQSVTISQQDARASVFNVGAGIEHKFGEKYSGYLSFNTDKSAHSDQSDIAVTGFDIYHMTGGANVVMGKTQWMLGASYAWGSETTQQIINLDPEGGVDSSDATTEVDFLYTRFTLMLGFTVAL